MTDYRFDVAISFAGDGKRATVRKVAETLKQELGEGKVFFDEWFEAELAGPDAHIVLQDIYRRSSRLVVACVCMRYGEKPWTQEEWRAIQAFERGLRDAGSGNTKRLRFLPLRFDDGEVDGLFDTAIVPDVRARSPKQIISLILERLRLINIEEPRIDPASGDHRSTERTADRAALDLAAASRASNDGGAPRYVLFVARERVGSLYLQVSPEILESEIWDDNRLIEFREPNAHAVDEAARIRAVRQLFAVVKHLEATTRIGDLNAIAAHGGRVDSDWYHVRGAFNAGPWDPQAPSIVLTSTVGKYSLTISCQKTDLTSVNREGSTFVPTSMSYALLDGGRGIPLSGLVKLAAVDKATKSIRGSALYLVVEPLNEDLEL